ncbi:MAG TPA: hypothetical protein PLU72_05925, partial [Candidatus Ozemobacteraceae bacterium]|nr:hypothetical protein [Candidatus Ozemobacteraceae bacterium]
IGGTIVHFKAISQALPLPYYSCYKMKSAFLLKINQLLLAFFAFGFVFGFPALYQWRYGNGEVPFQFLANDAFYYLTITKNSTNLPFYSFDGSNPTNGFHPLWQFCLSALQFVGLFGRDGGEVLISVFYVSLTLVSVSAGILCFSLTSRLAHIWVVFPFLIPGFSWLLAMPIAPDHLAFWSYANGMESPLSLFLFSLVIVVILTASDRVGAVVASILMGLGVLARLDDVFILLAILAYLVRHTQEIGARRVAVGIVVPLVFILSYLAYNIVTVGVLMPMSGSAKAGLAIVNNFRELVRLALPVFSWDEPMFSANRMLSYSSFSENFIREFQMFFPMIVCSIYLFLRRRDWFQGFPDIFSYIAAGVLGKCFYNVAFVSLWHQGYWYYAVPVIFSNILVALLVNELLNILPFWLDVGGYGRLLSGMVLFFFMTFLGNAFINHKCNERSGPQRQIFAERERVLKKRCSALVARRSSSSMMVS